MVNAPIRLTLSLSDTEARKTGLFIILFANQNTLYSSIGLSDL
jgi:hypothetical protein